MVRSGSRLAGFSFAKYGERKSSGILVSHCSDRAVCRLNLADWSQASDWLNANARVVIIGNRWHGEKERSRSDTAANPGASLVSREFKGFCASIMHSIDFSAVAAERGVGRNSPAHQSSGQSR
jgi:hypothetical protein